MFFRKEKKVVGIGIMLVLTTFACMTTNVSATNDPPIAEAGGPYFADECTPVFFDASSSYDPAGGVLDYRWNFNGSWTAWFSYPYGEYIWRDDYQGIVILEVRAGVLTALDTAEITVNNTPPFINSIEGPTSPVSVGDLVVVTVYFEDGDPRMDDKSLDTYIATFYWNDSTSSEYSISVGVFEVTGYHAYEQPGVYKIFIYIIDDNGGFTSGYFNMTVIAAQEFSVEAGPDGSIDEGSDFVSGGSFVSSSDTLFTAAIDYGDGSGSQPLNLNPDHSFTLSHHYCENGVYTVQVTVTKDGISSASDSALVTVANVAPLIISLSGPPTDPIHLGVSVNVVGEFTDPGCLDTHTVLIQWDDNQTTLVNLPIGEYQISCSHTYTNPGVYTIMFIVTDDDGGSDSKTMESYIVVYDPNCGFVTGGGWIIALPGSYSANPDLTGRCNFGFVSKYKKGHSIPEGNTEFQFQIADLNFHSNAYEWLVIAGPKAMYRGVGTINGHGNYGFILTGIDGQINGGGGIDKFRIKIWDKDQNDMIVFDNNLGAPDDQNPSTVISGGQITIHKT